MLKIAHVFIFKCCPSWFRNVLFYHVPFEECTGCVCVMGCPRFVGVNFTLAFFKEKRC